MNLSPGTLPLTNHMSLNAAVHCACFLLYELEQPGLLLQDCNDQNMVHSASRTDSPVELYVAQDRLVVGWGG